jgi:cation diffusion facilitator CzcD-associated flavoprotein CzcO
MNNVQQDVRVAIVGSGFAGLGMAIRLREAGIEDFVVLERADDVGGTWRDNRYPGCACDVPSHLYSFSFAPNPEWASTFSSQPEIWDYLLRGALRGHGAHPLRTRAARRGVGRRGPALAPRDLAG